MPGLSPEQCSDDPGRPPVRGRPLCCGGHSRLTPVPVPRRLPGPRGTSRPRPQTGVSQESRPDVDPSGSGRSSELWVTGGPEGGPSGRAVHHARVEIERERPRNLSTFGFFTGLVGRELGHFGDSRGYHPGGPRDPFPRCTRLFRVFRGRGTSGERLGAVRRSS